MKIFIIYNFCIGLSAYLTAGQTSNRNGDEWYKEWPTQPYAFGYEIRDLNGNEQYRKEMSDGDRVTGSYGYLGPDGLYRHVEYIADELGFRAKIRTSEPGTANDNPANVEIESNPIRVLSNPPPGVGSGVGGTGGAYDDRSTRKPVGGYRRDEVRRPDRPTDVNRSTYPNQPPIRLPEPSRGSNRDRIDINRGTEPNLLGDTRGGPIGDRVNFADIPDNVVPYRGGKPKRPDSIGSPRGEFDNRNVRPDYRGDPNYDRNQRIPTSQAPVGPSVQPFRGYDRSDVRNRGYGDNRGSPIGGQGGRGYEITDKIGSTKIPPKDSGFIEATKGPISPVRPLNKFYDNRPNAVFDDENEDQYDQFKRRQDIDRNVGVINKPVFEGRDSPQKSDGFAGNRYNTSRPEIRDGVKTIGPTIRESFNRSLNGSSFDANQARRDDFDKRVRRPTKVYVTSGPMSAIGDNRAQTPVRGVDRSFAPIDEQQRQQPFDVDYDDKNGRDGYRLDGVKGPTDRDRPLRPAQREQKPQTLDIKPYYGARRDGRVKSQDSLPPTRAQEKTSEPRVPAPPYDPRVEQQHLRTTDEDIPVNRGDEYPIDQQPVRGLRPQVYQPLRPDRRPDSQPSLPRRPDRPYKPRTQSQDRPYVEQQHIEVQPYQTQNSATAISSPVNTIPTAYKPIDIIENNGKTREYSDNPSLNTPLSPSSYIITPFPVNPINETIVQIKPIIEQRPDVFKDTPVLTQMEIPKFGTRIRTTEPPPQDTYEPIGQTFGDNKEDQQNQFNDNSYETNDNQNDYQTDNQNDSQNDYSNNNNNNPNDYSNSNPNDYPNPIVNENPNPNPIPNPNPNPNPNANPNQQMFDNIENDQYYSYYDDTDQTQDVESKEIPKSLVYTQTIAHRSDEKVNITTNSNNSLPIEIREKVMNLINWHKYDHSVADSPDKQSHRSMKSQTVIK